MLTAKTRWKKKSYSEALAQSIEAELHVSPLVAKLLATRGIETVEEAEQFIHVDSQTFYDPFLIESMDVAVERIHRAISNGEKILVFGDYDADGVTSTTIMIKALLELNANVDFYIPNRFTEGYGPNEPAFRKAKQDGVSLIVTVDTGISATHEAAVAKELGLDLIITDHHEPPAEMPQAYAIIHPRVGENHYPCGELAGAGVALKTAHALLGYLPEHLLVFAAIGTIADLVPLVDENRLIAVKGLRQISTTTNVGLRALLRQASLHDQPITEETVGFGLGPRINAVGRMSDATPAVHLFMTDDDEEATFLAKQVDKFNKERQQVVQVMTEEAVQEVEQLMEQEDPAVIVIAREGWNAGVIGIVASRLVDRFYRPTIVLSIDEEKGEAKGSARSITGFHMYDNLVQCSDLLVGFGGHPMAAGMTIRTEHIDEFHRRLNQFAKQILSDEDFTPIDYIDIVCNADDINLDVIEQFNKLAPFGMANPKPKVMLQDSNLKLIRRIGSDQNHLKVGIDSSNGTLDGIGFGLGYLYDEISPTSRISWYGELSINEWNGLRKPQIMIQDVEITDWQLFDLRGKKNIDKQLQSIPINKLMILTFRSKSIQRLKLNAFQESIIDLEIHKGKIDVTDKYVVLIDLPLRKEQLKTIFADGAPERIYAVLDHEDDHYFSMLPSRDHFKWYYGFLLKQQPFQLDKHAPLLAKRKGWPTDMIYFMSEVFFELNFARIENGLVYLMEKPTKKDIADSIKYQQKKEQMTLENDFVYSSYESLRKSFEEMCEVGLKLEEEVL
ncbi:single-stranded-DNA-specific exonuclease RecJ [Bacillus solimangrovi]|uniref:Single-stranded-DNA-specific exonuclease RecJ n=1 Tax=Bacillus solimangrovi TaxID=1305675 RepID=A0A1E5LBP5_9BACI|nr:single-stranded-DNA-specific exonuclease RecJ [Bacillus solimangrovi]OEH91496.1 single-stranded-DNA-specific exonuclease RecJ [Bacillus solimangrovi]